jgi:hypothetical protein
MRIARTYLPLGLTLTALLYATPALAQERVVGSIVALRGQATAVAPGGGARDLALKSPVRFRDTIRTGAGSVLQVMFDDESIVSVGENSEMTVDTYLYNPAQEDDSNCLLKFSRGLFRVVTGRITKANPDRFKVKTQMATIGIRGCEVGFLVEEGIEHVFVIELPDGLKIIIQKDLLDPSKIKDGRVGKADLIEVLKAGIVVIIEEAGGLRRRVATADELRALILGTMPEQAAFEGFFLPNGGVAPPVGPFPGVGTPPGGAGSGHWNNLPGPGLGLPGGTGGQAGNGQPNEENVPPGGGQGGLPPGNGGPQPQGEFKYVHHGSGTDWEWGFFGYVFPAGSDTIVSYVRPEIHNNSQAGLPYYVEAIGDGFDPVYDPILAGGSGPGSLTGEGIAAAVIEDPLGAKRHLVGDCTLNLDLWGYGENGWSCTVNLGDTLNGLAFEARGVVQDDGMLTGDPGVLPDLDTATPFQLTVDGVRFKHQTITFQQFVGTVVGPGAAGPGTAITGGILDYGILVNGGAPLGGHSVVGIAGADTTARNNGS